MKIEDEDEEPIIDQEVPHKKYGIYSYSILIQAPEEIQNAILSLLLQNLRINQARGTLQTLLNDRPLDIRYIRRMYNRVGRNLVRVAGADRVVNQPIVSGSATDPTATESSQPTEETQDPDCAICFDAIAPTDDITRMNCAHSDRFHYTCINQHYQNSNTCPLCRQQSFINSQVIDVANPIIREILRLI